MSAGPTIGSTNRWSVRVAPDNRRSRGWGPRLNGLALTGLIWFVSVLAAIYLFTIAAGGPATYKVASGILLAIFLIADWRSLHRALQGFVERPLWIEADPSGVRLSYSTNLVREFTWSEWAARARIFLFEKSPSPGQGLLRLNTPIPHGIWIDLDSIGKLMESARKVGYEEVTKRRSPWRPVEGQVSGVMEVRLMKSA
jgi:hypothetical protein